MPTKVSEYMTRKVITIQPEAGLREAFFLMRDEAIRHLPVTNEAGELIGIVSDRELRRPGWVDESPDIGHEYDLTDDLHIGDVMIRDIVHVRTYDTLTKAVGTLLDYHVGAAPVLDKTGDLVGILSAVDLLKAFQNTLETQKSNKKNRSLA
ncbi:histidine kinase [Photobacterium proteolyticum]|uniref:Histidine kinase n=1 Tax=Photobacterium proteolyticum TaxID=1903952 RepID=A0A1Q9GKD5_9GAMM|nr:CBS domain-containing protein [Photobacterium proteolyticum]OLQ74933.1 histidine kinase [Photobacterium proteolyticum]